MLLDSHLVERFHALHRQRLSGSLIAEGEGFRLEICLVEGEPAAIDIGRNLEEAFIEACRTYHKIDDAGLAELRAAVAGGAKGRDYLVSSQLVSEAEADQVSQSTIEDHLTRCFRGPCTRIDFSPGRGPDQLPVGVSAVRMRIGVEALIKTCDAQVGEIQAVEREVGGWGAVFALSEEENTSGALSEYEKMVLNFIDGRSTVEQIAELCRDSSLNLARVLRSLMAKKVIRRVADAAPAAAPTAAAASAAAVATPMVAAPARASVKEMVPYHAPRRESGSRAVVLAGLIVLLLIFLGVAVLVVQYNRRQDALRRDDAEISQLIAKRQWNDAQTTVAKLRQQAGTDISAVRTVDDLGARVEAALTAERTGIRELIASEEFPAARQRIAQLPEDGGLLAKLREVEEDSRSERNALHAEVRLRLDSGDIAGALAAIDAAPPKRQSAGEEELSLWRAGCLATARAAERPLNDRLQALARLRQARPDAATEAEVARLDGTLRKQVQELVGTLAGLERKAAAGAYVEAQNELARMHLGQLSAGGEVEVAASRVAAAAKASATAIQAAVEAGTAALARGEGRQALDVVRGRLAAVIQAKPQASGRDGLERLLGALAACAGSGARTVAERAEEAVTLAAQVDGDAALAQALKDRAEALRRIEVEAHNALEEARRLGREGDWTRAVAELKRIVGKSTWQQTAVHADAEQELGLAEQQAARRVQLRADLETALKKGDTAACEAIGREMGLAYLPLAVASVPDGAEVVAPDGKVLGTTPLVLDCTADQRVDLKLTIRRPGYDPVQRSGAQAEGGWRLMVELRRSPALQLELGHPLTARPAVVGGALWLADRGRAVRIAAPQAPAQVATHQVDAAAPLSEPIFAPVAEVAGKLVLATRERLGLRVDVDGAVQRTPLPAATDWAPLAFRSQVILDRELTIVAGRDGRLHAAAADARELWIGPAGAGFAAAPLLVGDAILCVRSDGRLERVRCEDGVLEGSAALAAAPVAAWSDGEALTGLAAESAWTWDGTKLATAQVPEAAIGGGPGVVVAASGRVLLRRGQDWAEVGKVDPRQATGHIAGAFAWGDRAVVAFGPILRVLGSDSFRVQAPADLLPPTLWGDRLVVASLEGGVWIFAP